MSNFPGSTICNNCNFPQGQHNRDQISQIDYCSTGTGQTFFPKHSSKETKVKGLSPDQPTDTNAAGGKQSSTPYRLDLIPPLAILAEAEVLAIGAKKYGENNWKKIFIQDHINHILQHAYAYLAGDRSDKHLANLACRAHFALELEEEYYQKMAGELSSPGPANPQLNLYKYDSNFCIYCKTDLRKLREFVGAGDGLGQKFSCRPCWEARQVNKEVNNSVFTNICVTCGKKLTQLWGSRVSGRFNCEECYKRSLSGSVGSSGSEI